MSYAKSEFANGHWEWKDEIKGVAFVSHKEVEVIKPQQQTIVITQAAGCTHTDLDLHFLDTVDTLDQIRFRRTIQRQIKPNEEEIVTLQDIKNVVLFQVMFKLPAEFIDMIHTHEADRFFRSLIFYFQLFLQYCDDLTVRRLVGENKLRQPATITVENVLLDNLADLRSVVARDYCVILMGMGRVEKYHHMANTLNTSAPERDIRLFELLLRISTRIVWIALQRRSLNLIEHELYRIFRTQEFNLAIRRTRRSLIVGTGPVEKRILSGEKCDEVFRLLSRSPAAIELLKSYHDFRLLGAGFIHFDKKDERIKFLEAAFTLPEQELKNAEIPFGILGKCRDDFDAMLMPLLVHEEKEHELCYKSLAMSSLSYMTIETKTYELVKIPQGDDCMEDAVPSEIPKKGVFSNNMSSQDQEKFRMLWRSIKC